MLLFFPFVAHLRFVGCRYVGQWFADATKPWRVIMPCWACGDNKPGANAPQRPGRFMIAAREPRWSRLVLDLSATISSGLSAVGFRRSPRRVEARHQLRGGGGDWLGGLRCGVIAFGSRAMSRQRSRRLVGRVGQVCHCESKDSSIASILVRRSDKSFTTTFQVVLMSTRKYSCTR